MNNLNRVRFVDRTCSLSIFFSSGFASASRVENIRRSKVQNGLSSQDQSRRNKGNES